MPDPMLYVLVPIASYLIGVVSARVRFAMKHAQDDSDARSHGFTRTRPVSIRKGLSVYRATRSYTRGPIRVDLYYDRNADHSTAERLGLQVPFETYAVSFPDEAGYPQATFKRVGPFSGIGRIWDFAERYSELLDIDIDTNDVDGLVAMLTPALVAYLSDLPEQVEQVWIRDGRIYFVLRASGFDDPMLSLPAIESAMSAFSKA